MANTIKIKHAFRFSRTPSTTALITIDRPLIDTEVSTTSELAVVTKQIVGTTHEAVALGDVTDTAMMIVENIHATATVSVGGDSAGSFVKWFDIAAGDPPAVIPRVGTLASTYLKSSAANTPISVTLVKIS